MPWAEAHAGFAVDIVVYKSIWVGTRIYVWKLRSSRRRCIPSQEQLIISAEQQEGFTREKSAVRGVNAAGVSSAAKCASLRQLGVSAVPEAVARGGEPRDDR